MERSAGFAGAPAAGLPTLVLPVDEPADAGPARHFLLAHATIQATPAQLHREILSEPLPIVPARDRLFTHVFQRFEERLPVWLTGNAIIGWPYETTHYCRIFSTLHVCCLPYGHGRIAGSARSCDREGDGSGGRDDIDGVVAERGSPSPRRVAVRVRGVHRRRHGRRVGSGRGDLRRAVPPPPLAGADLPELFAHLLPDTGGVPSPLPAHWTRPTAPRHDRVPPDRGDRVASPRLRQFR